MTCICCGPTNRAVLADGYGFLWCGKCYARAVAEIEFGLGQLERYLAVKARQSSTLDLIREYTDGGEQ